jgi:hypothetical protein
MRTSTALLLALLVASNAAWLLSGWATRSHDELPRDAPSRIGTAESRPQEVAPPASLFAPAPAEAPALAPSPRADVPDPEARVRARQEREAAERRAWEEVRGWRMDALQVLDPGRRDRGVAALAEAVRSDDPALAYVALNAASKFRSPYDAEALRDGVRSRLGDEDVRIRRAAAQALLRLRPEASDADVLLDLHAARPKDEHLLETAVAVTRSVQGRVEGRLADRWLAAFAAAEPRDQLSLAHTVGNVWVSEEVEHALVEAFRARSPAERADGWYGALGPVRPVREERVRLVFEELRGGDPERMGPRRAAAEFRDIVQRRDVEPSAARVAAALAVDLLHEPVDSGSVHLAFEVLRVHGTPAEVPALRAYATNRMATKSDQYTASQLADQIERRAR